jgi:hypothetical protein
LYFLLYDAADPLSLLVDNALVASWVRQGLPSDPTSVQNGTILTNSERWPLMMDPQLQGVVWIKERESKNNLQVRCCRTQSDTKDSRLQACRGQDRGLCAEFARLLLATQHLTSHTMCSATFAAGAVHC